MAAQMLAGEGFKDVYNLTGGIKAWNSETAVGPEDMGLSLFSGNESPEETLIVGYLLEAGLRDFYLSMIPDIKNENVRRLFEKLSTIEEKHQQRIFDEYVKISQKPVSRDEFEKNKVVSAMEGGLTTEEYLKRYRPDLEVVEEVVSLAMGIEAQALDLYSRAAQRAETERSRDVLLQIAEEEKAHIEQLGKLMAS